MYFKLGFQHSIIIKLLFQEQGGSSFCQLSDGILVHSSDVSIKNIEAVQILFSLIYLKYNID
jgi:hypothetical protein